MIHPDIYIKAASEKGYGAFAGRDFRRGEILWILDDIDIRIPLEEYLKFSDAQLRKYNVYSYLDMADHVIMPWDEGKYVNHSCSPNSTGLVQFDNISIALRDIAKDEEIVEDYDCYYGHFESFACMCKSPNCRKVVNHPEKEIRMGRIDLKDIAHQIISHPQPLLEFSSREAARLMVMIHAVLTVG